jgi:hypothetical protein
MFLSIGLLIVIWCALWLILPTINPMRRSHERATEYILTLTPIGMSIDETLETLENHSLRNWRIVRVNYERGFMHPRPQDIYPTPYELPHIVGTKSIRVDAGPFIPAEFWGMGMIMERNVSIFWAFNPEGELIEVYVWISFR